MKYPADASTTRPMGKSKEMNNTLRFVVFFLLVVSSWSCQAAAFSTTQSIFAKHAFSPIQVLSSTSLAFSSVRDTSLQLAERSSSMDDGSAVPHQAKKKKKKRSKKKIFVTLWIHVMSIFVAFNYFKTNSQICWPVIMLKIPLRAWNLVHGLSAMTFAGSILTTTVLEWNLFGGGGGNGSSNKKKSEEETAGLAAVVNNLFNIETFLVLPALSGSMISGVAQSFISYRSLRYAPRHVKTSLHLLLLFGLWWGVTDRRTQGKLEEAAANGDFQSSVWSHRRFSNAVSCLFLVGLYSTMILKPGYPDVS